MASAVSNIRALERDIKKHAEMSEFVASGKVKYNAKTAERMRALEFHLAVRLARDLMRWRAVARAIRSGADITQHRASNL